MANRSVDQLATERAHPFVYRSTHEYIERIFHRKRWNRRRDGKNKTKNLGEIKKIDFENDGTNHHRTKFHPCYSRVVRHVAGRVVVIVVIVVVVVVHPFWFPPLQNLFETMIYVCELLTEEPEGGSAMIPLPTFIHLYQYLAELDCSGRYSYIEEKLEPFPCVCSDFKIPSLEPSVEVKNRRAFFLFFFPRRKRKSFE